MRVYYIYIAYIQTYVSTVVVKPPKDLQENVPVLTFAHGFRYIQICTNAIATNAA